MTGEDTAPTTDSAASTQAGQPARTWPAVLTWRAHEAPRMESVRVQLSGNRIKAAGRIIGGECAEHPAFSASYDLVTDENGVTRRLSLRISLAGGEKQASVSRDDEGYWMIENSTNHQRSTYNGALDVDVVLSPFFNTLPIRRLGLHTDSTDNPHHQCQFPHPNSGHRLFRH